MADSKPETEFVECGLCYENDELKRLPCSPGHILCVTCLTRDSAETKIVQCPFCKQVSEGSVDSLPSANSPLDEFRCCDVCRRKDDKYKLAQTYCMDCKKRFCISHLESHNDALDDHKRIPMSEYLKDYRKMETRYCTDHHDQVYSLACKKCYGVYCPFCSPWESQCKDGSSHQMVALDKFVSDLISDIAEKKVWIFDKEETILGIVKELTRVISDWDTDTEDMIQQIRQARDKQIEEITAKYEDLERKMAEMRKNAMTEVSEYLDGDVGTKLTKLTREIRKIDSRVFTQHKVDVVNGFKDTERLCYELMQMKVPVYKPSANHVSVSITDENQNGEIKAQILQWTGTCHQKRMPTSLKLLRKVKVASNPDSVVHHHQSTFVGLRNCTVARIADDSQHAVKFLDTIQNPYGVAIHNDLLYILGYGQSKPHSIRVCDISGALVREWSHSATSGGMNKICVVNEQIVVCNKPKHCLTVYSLTGELIKEIYCANMTNDIFCMTTAPESSVIVSDSNSGCVFSVNIETGKVMWNSKHVTTPGGVTCYGDQYVLVTNNNTDSRIWILDVLTGKYLGEMVGESDVYYSWAVDLHIYDDDTLIVPRFNESMVYFYQIS